MLQGWGMLSAVREDWLKGLLLRMFAGLWCVLWGGAVETAHQLQEGVICITVVYQSLGWSWREWEECRAFWEKHS